MNIFLEGSERTWTDQENRPSGKSGRQRMQSQLSLEMMAVDRECAITALKAWAKFLEVGSGRQHAKCFTSLEEYFPYRIMDVGEMWGCSLSQHGHCQAVTADPKFTGFGMGSSLMGWACTFQNTKLRLVAD